MALLKLDIFFFLSFLFFPVLSLIFIPLSPILTSEPSFSFTFIPLSPILTSEPSFSFTFIPLKSIVTSSPFFSLTFIPLGPIVTSSSFSLILMDGISLPKLSFILFLIYSFIMAFAPLRFKSAVSFDLDSSEALSDPFASFASSFCASSTFS